MLRPVAAVLGLCVLSALPAALPRTVAAEASKQQIDAAIQDGIGALRSAKLVSSSNALPLVAYTLLKTGTPPDDPTIQAAVQGIQASIQSGRFNGRPNHFYTAGTAALLLEALDPDGYRPQLEALAQYILDGQQPGGFWYYPDQDPKNGDTSISQYSLLGLWAAKRAGISVPDRVWDKNAAWLIRTQFSNGGFCYHPGEQGELGQPTHSMTVAGTSSLILNLRQLFPDARITNNAPDPTIKLGADRKPVPKFPDKLYGILEIVDITRPEPEAGAAAEGEEADIVRTSLGDMQRHIRRGLSWLDSNYAMKVPTWNMYYIYGIERLGAFGELEQIGSHDWYQDGAEFLISTQLKEGGWSGRSEQVPATCFGILFLYRATARSIGPPPSPAPKLGTGLLAGGRGLPEDLTAVKLKDGRIAVDKVEAPIGDLLKQLEMNAGAELEPLQEAVIESVRSEDREKLIGQVDRLRRLMQSKDPNVRRIALWALARSNDLTQVPLFLAALDPQKEGDLDVAIEANNGLCILSRRLDGVGVEIDPLAGRRDELSPEEQQGIVNKWRLLALDGWTKWYRSIRRYNDRDDLLDLRGLKSR